MKPVFRHKLFAAAASVLCAASSVAQQPAPAAGPASPTVAAIKSKGFLTCGVLGSAANFSLPDSQGVMRGIDADSCRAIAAAVLGDPNKVKYVSLTPAQRLPAVQSGEVDVAYANITWTMTRETKSGVQFAAVNYYDAAGFLAHKAVKATSATKLNGASVCMIAGPGEVNAAEFFGKHKVRYTAVPFADGEQMRKAFLAKRCDVVMNDASSLASFRASLGDQAKDYVFLPEVVGRDPLAGAVRKSDDRWFDIVRYTHNALVMAEEMGITSDNVRGFPGTEPAIKRFLGTEGDLGPSLGLDKEWAVNAVAAVGNYGQMWQRAFGETGLQRGQNRLASQGGLQYAYPMR